MEGGRERVEREGVGRKRVGLQVALGFPPYGRIMGRRAHVRVRYGGIGCGPWDLHGQGQLDVR